ncbi:13204_t:CDS:2 [Rhizophagus irregularis]|nr:13204_t:CDS:2 [Rhizophagus irregularis]
MNLKIQNNHHPVINTRCMVYGRSQTNEDTPWIRPVELLRKSRDLSI